MKRARPWDGDNVDVLSSGESSSSDVEKGNHDLNDNPDQRRSSISSMFQLSVRASSPEEEEKVVLGRRAEIYQQYMKQIPIPTNLGSVVPFDSWLGLGKSLKKVYGQPLHYLTNVLLQQWDQERIGSDEEYQSLDIVIHPSKAEATVWLIEEVHRKTSSHHHLAQLWLLNPMYQAYIDSV